MDNHLSQVLENTYYLGINWAIVGQIASQYFIGIFNVELFVPVDFYHVFWEVFWGERSSDNQIISFYLSLLKYIIFAPATYLILTPISAIDIVYLVN